MSNGDGNFEVKNRRFHSCLYSPNSVKFKKKLHTTVGNV